MPTKPFKTLNLDVNDFFVNRVKDQVARNIDGLMFRVEAGKGSREAEAQHDQPGGQEDQPIGDPDPKGNLRKEPVIGDPQHLGNKVAQRHESDQESEIIPHGTECRRIEDSVPSDRYKDKYHDEEERHPFEGIDPILHSADAEIRHLEDLPSEVVVALAPIRGREPAVQIEILYHNLAGNRRADVHEISDPFRESSSERQNHNPDVKPYGAGGSDAPLLAQGVRQLKKGKTEDEPGNRINDRGRQEMVLVVDSKVPFRFDGANVELCHLLPRKITASFFSKKDQPQEVSCKEQ